MVINENNSHINSFTKGMNSDTAYDQILNTQYTYGQNIRITKNQMLGGASDYSTIREGVISPVPVGRDAEPFVFRTNDIQDPKIIATESIDNISIIICSYREDGLVVFKIDPDSPTDDPEIIWKADNFFNGKSKDISAVLYKELDNVIKLYIASAVCPIITLRVDDQRPNYRIENNKFRDKDYLINNRIMPKDPVYIDGVIDGRLITSQVQYTYRFYNKYGNSTQLAPLTNKIQVISPVRDKEVGNAENTETSIGFTINIPIKGYKSLFDRMLIFRLSFIKPNEDSEIALIYDDKIKDVSNNTFILNDVGIEPLQVLTIEEFSAMSGLLLKPRSIATNQLYMFCSNVEDDTIIKVKPNVDSNPIQLVRTRVTLADKVDNGIPSITDSDFKELDLIKKVEGNIDTISVNKYFESRNINHSLAKSSYNNLFTSSLLRSLRRGESYKYGIVYYDDKGRRSDVHEIKTIKVPELSKTSPSFEVNSATLQLQALPIGVEIKLPQPIINSDEDINIVGCQIVRRSSSEIYLNTLLLVALARPVLLNLALLNKDWDTENKSPFYPSGFLSTTDMMISSPYYLGLIDYYASNGYVTPKQSQELNFYKYSADTRNKLLFQIFSSEIDFRRDDVLNKLNVSDIKIQEQLCVYPRWYKRYGDLLIPSWLTGDKYKWEDGLRFFGILDWSPGTSSSGSSLQSSVVTHTYTSTKTAFAGFGGGIEWVSCWIIPAEDMKNAISVAVSPENVMCQSLAVKGVGSTFHIISNLNNILDTTAIIDNISSNQNSYIIPLNNGEPVEMSFKLLHATITKEVQSNTNTLQSNTTGLHGMWFHKDLSYKLSTDEKTNIHWVFNHFNVKNINIENKQYEIKSIKDVKIPGWNDGFTNILRNDGNSIIDAIKKYKQYTTTIDQYVYNNWVSSCKYDFKVSPDATVANQYHDDPDEGEFLNKSEHAVSYKNNQNWNKTASDFIRSGYIGPGTSCFLMVTKEDFGTYPDNNNLYTSICNIKHSPKIENVQSDERTTYFGFGNYFKLKKKSGKYVVDDGTDLGSETMVVFDGDIYITPHEITTMYKTYNFESPDTLLSTLITNYIPLESKVNTYFDYGQNLRNTNSANLIYEPGQIEGIITQERPAHQYNMIYSDNDASNDVFTLISTDDNETNKFPQRTYFSEPKTNGEFIDNFLIFKPASFIDVEGTYGQITELATNKNILYYWQEHAFGKFSVNERSLINDTNGNTIMLGQAGILSRYDYIDTRYGMREADRCECPVDDMVYWVDINNKAIIAGNSLQAVNYGERVGVLNIINDKISTKKPYVHHDLLNDELLCKCLRSDSLKYENQLIFNTKYNMATSIYTRRYDDMLNVKNHLYTAYITDNDDLQINKINYLTNTENVKFLSPIQLRFVVNPNASITKVFDSQLVVPIKRNVSKESFDNTQMTFETDTFSKVIGNMQDRYTDREGNIIYNVPRWGNEQYGNRIRGKWMLVDMYNDDPTEYSGLSHVITKFRQSFS